MRIDFATGIKLLAYICYLTPQVKLLELEMPPVLEAMAILDYGTEYDSYGVPSLLHHA